MIIEDLVKLFSEDEKKKLLEKSGFDIKNQEFVLGKDANVEQQGGFYATKGSEKFPLKKAFEKILKQRIKSKIFPEILV